MSDTVELQNQDGSKVDVHLHGATVISWVDRSEEKLFCSKKSLFDNKKAIRGGIPLVFPQFGPWSLGPQHGFARIKRWTLENAPQLREDGTVSASFSLVDDDDTRKMWDTKFKLVYTVCLGKDNLQLSLDVTNKGNESFSFTTLMHTYFHVPDIKQALISGLKGCTFMDKVVGDNMQVEDRENVFVHENYDRVYNNVPGDVVLTPDVHNDTCKLQMSTTNMSDIVVWNPWADKAAAMSDFGDEEYKTMLCVEAGSVTTPTVLGAGCNVTFTQTIVSKVAKNKL